MLTHSKKGNNRVKSPNASKHSSKDTRSHSKGRRWFPLTVTVSLIFGLVCVLAARVTITDEGIFRLPHVSQWATALKKVGSQEPTSVPSHHYATVAGPDDWTPKTEVHIYNPLRSE